MVAEIGVRRKGTHHEFMLSSKKLYPDDSHFCISELLFSLDSIIHSWNQCIHLVDSDIESGISILEEGEKLLTQVVVVITPPIEYTYKRPLLKLLYWKYSKIPLCEK